VLETQAAEQVKYWISQDVQNAELQLDGLGENPVEVSISMQGNEAHVAFRTDELQTHSLLEGAGAQLKDMLLREGVVLAGVSVGTSGTNDGRGGERRPRQGTKIAQVMPALMAPAEAIRRPGGSSGRSVDLFV
jgi:flagellar hook-length control protein FliK